MVRMKRFLLLLIFSFFTFNLSYCYGQSGKTEEELKKDMENTYIEFCSQLNKQTPIEISELITLKSVFFVNWFMIFNYSLNISIADFTEAELMEALDEFKDAQKKSIPIILSNGGYPFTGSELYEYLKWTELKFRSVYYDAFGKYIGGYQLDYRDFPI